MKAVIQRVTCASVEVNGEIVGAVEKGFLIFLGVEIGDTQKNAEVLAEKIYGLRIFSDENGKMNLSLKDVGGNVLIISQFTLFADCKKGRRPYFIGAEKMPMSKDLYDYFCEYFSKCSAKNVAKGIFGEDMKVSLTNDGPVTIIIDTKDLIK